MDIFLKNQSKNLLIIYRLRLPNTSLLNVPTAGLAAQLATWILGTELSEHVGSRVIAVLVDQIVGCGCPVHELAEAAVSRRLFPFPFCQPMPVHHNATAWNRYNCTIAVVFDEIPINKKELPNCNTYTTYASPPLVWSCHVSTDSTWSRSIGSRSA